MVCSTGSILNIEDPRRPSFSALLCLKCSQYIIAMGMVFYFSYNIFLFLYSYFNMAYIMLIWYTSLICFRDIFALFRLKRHRYVKDILIDEASGISLLTEWNLISQHHLLLNLCMTTRPGILSFNQRNYTRNVLAIEGNGYLSTLRCSDSMNH